MNNQMTISGVIKQAWQLVYGIKWPFFWLGILSPFVFLPLFLVAVMYVARMVIYNMLHFPASEYAMHILFLGLKAAYIILAWYLFALLINLGVRQANAQPVIAPLAFQDCMRVKSKLLGVLLIVLLFFGALYFAKVSILFSQFEFLFLCVLYFLSFCFMTAVSTFVIPLIVFRQYGLKEAFIVGFKTFNQYKLVTLVCWFIFSIMNLICFVIPPLQIGLIWSVPVLFMCIGVLFRNSSL